MDNVAWYSLNSISGMFYIFFIHILSTDMVVSEDCEVEPSRTEILSDLFTELGNGLAISDAGSTNFATFMIKCKRFDCIVLLSPNIKQ